MTSPTVNGEAGALRLLLEQACAEAKCSAGALTVLAAQNDPFRVDTPASHRDGEWLAVHADRLGLGSRKIHLRGLHYMLVGRRGGEAGRLALHEHRGRLDWLVMTRPRRRAGSATSRSIRSSTPATASR